MRYALRSGEHLAVSGDAIKRDADGFFLLMGGEPTPNETRGSVAIVNVRGALQHFKGPMGDSYEGIEERVAAALSADPAPSTVMLRIESPGGLVAGLNECVLKLQRMSKAAKIPLVAFVDEMAASAAYALCCACSEVLAPPSAIIGSVGVISSMVSTAKADEKDGIDFRIITSGKRKADGHVHLPITEDAVKAETARNEELARQFFALAGKARGMAPERLDSLEAAIYLGKAAAKVGLIDDVMSFDEAIFGLDVSSPNEAVPTGANQGNVTDRRAKLDKPKLGASSLTQSDALGAYRRSGTTQETHMPVKLAALIKTTEAALSTETDPKKIRSLQAKMAAFSVTRAELDGDDDDDDDDKKKKDDDDDGDESKSAKHAARAEKLKAKAKATDLRSKASQKKSEAAELEEEAKKCEEESSGSEEEDEAHVRVGHPSAALTAGQMAAIASQGDIARDAITRIDRLERDAAARNLSAMISEARAARRITPGEAKTLSKKPAAFVKDFLEMRPHTLVAIDEEALLVPDGSPAGDIPANVKSIVEQSITAMNLSGDKAEEFRKTSYAEHRKVIAKSNNAGVTH